MVNSKDYFLYLDQIQIRYKINPDFKNVDFIFTNFPINLSLTTILKEPKLKSRICTEIQNMAYELVKMSSSLKDIKIKFVIEYKIANISEESSVCADSIIGVITDNISTAIEQNHLQENLQKISDEFDVVIPGMIPSTKGIRIPFVEDKD